MAKRSLEKWKTYNSVFDEFTRRNLFRLQSQGIFEDMVSHISQGKEALIFLATTKKQNQEDKTNYVIIKIYRLENCDFNQMFNLLRMDKRYINIKRSKRDVIFTWAQREFRNIMRARSVIRVPIPIKQYYNILIMEMIGDNEPARKIKDDIPKYPQKFFDTTMENIIKMMKINLVHGDLSQYNILNNNEEPVFIDFSQAVPLNDVSGKEILFRDVDNLIKFFNKNKAKIKQAEIRETLLQEMDTTDKEL
ncbi:serine protein kinase RIO [Candidatus Woesearchaeota archaeon]|nr:serine protein kinase RIO [Candidatus Woesearchaeota archaeon]